VFESTSTPYATAESRPSTRARGETCSVLPASCWWPWPPWRRAWSAGRRDGNEHAPRSPTREPAR